MTSAYVASLSNKELRDKLIEHGVLIGPVTDTSRRVYEKKLTRLLDTSNTHSTKSSSRTDVSEKQVSHSPPRSRSRSNGSNRAFAQPKPNIRLEDDYSSPVKTNAVKRPTTRAEVIMETRHSPYAASREERIRRIEQDDIALDNRPTPRSATRRLFHDSLLSNVSGSGDKVSKKITTTPPLQRHRARNSNSDAKDNLNFYDDHMEWSRELSDFETRRFIGESAPHCTKFDTSFLHKNNSTTKQVKSWFNKNGNAFNYSFFSALIILTIYGIIYHYPTEAQNLYQQFSDAVSSVVLLCVHYAVIPAAIVAVLLALGAGGYFLYRNQAKSNKLYETEKRDLLGLIIKKVQSAAPVPVPIKQLRDDIFPVYERNVNQLKLWKECEEILRGQDSRIRCDIHRTGSGDTVEAFRWIGASY